MPSNYEKSGTGTLYEFLSVASLRTSPARYEVVLSVPLPGFNLGVQKSLMYSCENAEVPSSSYLTQDLQINGLPKLPLPYQKSFTNMFNLTFRVDKTFAQRSFFEYWQSEMYNVNKPGMRYFEDYVGSIIIKQLDWEPTTVPQQFQPVTYKALYGVKINQVYPVTIQELPMAYEAVNVYHRQTITFAFYDWERII
jgi:hypothetical protein